MFGEQAYLLCFGDAEAAARIAFYGLPAALFLAGLAGSFLHCLGMCGPFVLGQVAGRALSASENGQSYGELRRLRDGALLPYHLGRITTYAGLGALAGLIGRLIFSLPHLRSVAAALLLFAALVLLAQMLPRLASLLPANRALAPLAGLLLRLAGKKGGAPGRSLFALYRFGLLLGFLPCGFLWSALAASAASGGAAEGALAMACFGFGTVPALAGLGWSGALFGRRHQDWLRAAALPLQGLNVAFLLWISARVINGL